MKVTSLNLVGNANMPQIPHNALLEKLAKQYRETDLKIKELRNQLKDVQASKTELETVTIPNVMAETGYPAVTLPSGTRITVNTVNRIRLAKLADGETIDTEKRDKFYDWLQNNGFEGLVKSIFAIYTNEPELIDVLKEACNQLNLDYEYSFKSINWRTLEAWYKEQVQAGTQLPYSLFESFNGSVATVK